MKVKVKNKNVEEFVIEDATKVDIEHDGFLYRIQIYVDGTLLINKSNGLDDNLKIMPPNRCYTLARLINNKT